MENFTVSPPEGYKPRTTWDDIPDFLGYWGVIMHGIVFVVSLVVGAVAFGGWQVKYALIVAGLSFLLSTPGYWMGYGGVYRPLIDPPSEMYLVWGLITGILSSIVLMAVSVRSDPDPVRSALCIAGASFTIAVIQAYRMYRKQKKALESK